MVLDSRSFGLQIFFRLPFPNYPMIGRWIGSRSLVGLRTYGIGVLFAGLLIAVAGVGWLNAPTFLPALAIGVATVVAPYFIMQPAMGLGVASSKTPNPNVARLRSLAAHTVFGIGLYLAALVLALAW